MAKGSKKFDRSQVEQALKNAGVSASRSAEVIGELTGEKPAPPRSRGSGAAEDRTPNFQF